MCLLALSFQVYNSYFSSASDDWVWMYENVERERVEGQGVEGMEESEQGGSGWGREQLWWEGGEVFVWSAEL